MKKCNFGKSVRDENKNRVKSYPPYQHPHLNLITSLLMRGLIVEKAQQPIWGKIWNNQHQDYQFPHHNWLQCMNQWFGWWVRNERMGGSNPVLFQSGDNFTLWVKAETASRVILKLGYWVLSATYQTAWKSRNFLILILGKGSKIEEEKMVCGRHAPCMWSVAEKNLVAFSERATKTGHFCFENCS